MGPNNKRRFRHSHYVADAPTISTLAQSLLKPNPGAVDMAGIQHLDVFGVENWMLTNLDRIHFFIPGERLQVCAALRSTFVPVSAASARAPPSVLNAPQ